METAITITKTPAWTGADLVAWMHRTGLTSQRAAAMALGCSQGLVSLMTRGISPVEPATVRTAIYYEQLHEMRMAS